MHTLQIAILRARLVARSNIGRAVSLLTAVGFSLNEAAHWLLHTLRSNRVPA